MRRRDRRVCPECGCEFECRPSDPKRACSDRCAGLSRRGERNPKFNGGLSESEGRTVIVHRDGTWTFYYRALMEAHLGRELLPSEVVHHINGDPTDDRIENLQVLSRAAHMEIHRPELLAARKAAA